MHMMVNCLEVFGTESIIVDFDELRTNGLFDKNPFMPELVPVFYNKALRKELVGGYRVPFHP